MALLKNRFQFLFYGVCENTIDSCVDQRIETLLNSNTNYRKYITDIIEYSDDGTEPIFYEVFTHEKYKTVKSLLKLSDNELLDDRLKPPFKNFKCGSMYIFVCKDIIDVSKEDINIPGFANVASPEIPIELTGLVTTECCISQEQNPTPLTDRYQFIWYGVCSNCTNQRIEEVLNKDPQYREYITDIIKYSDDGTEPIFYEVLSTEKYTTLKSLLKLEDNSFLDDRLKPSFKEFKCGETYIVTCRGDISILENGLKIQNVTTKNKYSRISRCNTEGTLDLKLKSTGCKNPIDVIFPPTIPNNAHTDIAILLRKEEPHDDDNWKDISYWDYIAYTKIFNKVNKGTQDEITDEGDTGAGLDDHTESTPTPSYIDIASDHDKQKIVKIPLYEICPSLTGCPPKENEFDDFCVDDLISPEPTDILHTPTPTYSNENAINIIDESRIKVNFDAYITIIDIGCSTCGFGNKLTTINPCPPPPSPSTTFYIDPPPPPTQTESFTPTPSTTLHIDPPPTPTLTASTTPTVTYPCPWFDCNGVCEGDAETDCAGICNGNTEVDCAGICGGDTVVDCLGVCNGDAILDCEGTCNGDAKLDCANICNGDTKLDCAGICGGDTKIDVCGECGGSETDINNCPCEKDCAGVCEGDAKLDCAGVCNGDAKPDCAGICNGDTKIDCAGICGGNSKTDCLGICNGGAKIDCNGICNGDAKIDCLGICNGIAREDCAGICNGDTKIDCAGVCGGDAKVDCLGVCGGDAVIDCAGICNGDTKVDCLGVCGGDAVIDCAGICNGNTKLDCLGICDGDAELDCAGICEGDTKHDCAGICGGNTKIDVCGECGGGETNPDKCPCIKDCAGVCNGDAKLDCMGVCNGTATEDCLGVCGGNAFFDCLGVCDGNAKLDCNNVCNGDAKIDCEGVCNGDAKLDCLGVCNGDAKLDCLGVCNGNAKKDCLGICNGNAEIDCFGVCNGNARKDCAGICGGNTPIDCMGVCGGDAIRDCKGICNGNTKVDCRGVCGGNCRVDICGVCCGNGRNPDDCCVECEESFGELEMFNHGVGWQGEPAVEMRMMVKDRSAPVWEIAKNTYRIYGDLEIPFRNPLPLFDLARYRKDEQNNPQRGEGILATSLQNDTCDSLGTRGNDSMHLRFLDNDAVKIDNESNLITIQSRITSDIVTDDPAILKWRHTFTLRDAIDIRDGDDVYIRSITNSLKSTYTRGQVRKEANNSWSILASYSEKRPFASIDNVTVLFVLNRIAVPTIGNGQANGCPNRADRLLPGESDIFRYKVGDEIEVTNTKRRTLEYKITEINENLGTITFDGKLRGHIGWWSFAMNDNNGPFIARTEDEQQNPTSFDTLPSVKNKTTPCMIRLRSRTDIPNSWEEVVGPFGTYVVFDARLNGKMWGVHRINTIDRRLFYVLQKSLDGDEDMLCSECSCAFRIRSTQNAQGDPPGTGPRSVCAVIGNNIRNHAIRTFDFPSVNPTLDNDRLAIKTRDGGENYIPYMAGYLPNGVFGPNNPDLIDLARATRVDYWEFETGDFEV